MWCGAVRCGAVSGKMRYWRCRFETVGMRGAQVDEEQVRGTGPALNRLHVTHMLPSLLSLSIRSIGFPVLGGWGGTLSGTWHWFLESCTCES